MVPKSRWGEALASWRIYWPCQNHPFTWKWLFRRKRRSYLHLQWWTHLRLRSKVSHMLTDEVLRWKDLITALIQRLHHLNASPSTRACVFFSQEGFKVLMRRYLGHEGHTYRYECSQYPAGEDFAMIAGPNAIEGRRALTIFLAHVIGYSLQDETAVSWSLMKRLLPIQMSLWIFLACEFS